MANIETVARWVQNPVCRKMHIECHLFAQTGEMESNSTDPTDRSVLQTLAVALLDLAYRLLGRPMARTGDLVYFTDAELVADMGAFSARVIEVESPPQGAGSAWWYRAEPTSAASDRALATETPETFWVREDHLTSDPEATPAGRDVAAATQADASLFVSHDELDGWLETALEDLGFHANVTVDPETESVSAVFTAPPEQAEPARQGVHADAQPEPTTGTSTATTTDDGPLFADQPDDSDEVIVDVTDGATDDDVAAAIVAVEDGDTDAADASVGHSDDRDETATSADESDRSIPAAVGVPDDTADSDSDDDSTDGTVDDDDSGRPEPSFGIGRPAPEQQPPPTPDA
jgi:hypothetical protein